MPGWFSWLNQGAGVAVGDLTGAGGRDVVLLQVDAPPAIGDASGQNEGCSRIGVGLDRDGLVEWDPDWLGVPHWTSLENAGAGVALAQLGGALRLVVLMVDDPDGKNSGPAAKCSTCTRIRPSTASGRR